MTKYEWETELKKCIHRLPPEEIKRVMEYYSELFEDHIERGKNETQIINEFGNPVDVAFKILSEYDAEVGAKGDMSDGTAASKKELDVSYKQEEARVAPTVATEKAISGENKYDGRAADVKQKRDNAVKCRSSIGKTVGRIFKTIGYVLLAVIAVAFLGGGAYSVIVSFGVAAKSAGAGLVHMSMGAVMIGIGLLSALPFAVKFFGNKQSDSIASNAAKEKRNEDKN